MIEPPRECGIDNTEDEGATLNVIQRCIECKDESCKIRQYLLRVRTVHFATTQKKLSITESRKKGSLEDAKCPDCGSTSTKNIMCCPDVGDSGYWVTCKDCGKQYGFGDFWKDRKAGLI